MPDDTADTEILLADLRDIESMLGGSNGPTQRIRRILDRLRAAERDAARYRWLRDCASGEIIFDHTERDYRFQIDIPFDGEPINNDAESAARMDAAIDAAAGDGER